MGRGTLRQWLPVVWSKIRLLLNVRTTIFTIESAQVLLKAYSALAHGLPFSFPP